MEDASWSGKADHVHSFPSAGFVSLFYQHPCNRSTFSFKTELFFGRSHVGPLFTNEEQKRVVSWCNRHLSQTCQPCAKCHRPTLPDTKWQYSQPRAQNWPNSIFDKVDQNLTQKLPMPWVILLVLGGPFLTIWQVSTLLIFMESPLTEKK